MASQAPNKPFRLIKNNCQSQLRFIIYSYLKQKRYKIDPLGAEKTIKFPRQVAIRVAAKMLLMNIE